MDILVVEDTAVHRVLIQGILKQHRLILCETGTEALGCIENKFDLILLDMNLPDMTGFDILKEVQARGVKTPVIIISGATSPEEIMQGRLAGAHYYVTKPYTREELLHAIEVTVVESNLENR